MRFVGVSRERIESLFQQLDVNDAERGFSDVFDAMGVGVLVSGNVADHAGFEFDGRLPVFSEELNLDGAGRELDRNVVVSVLVKVGGFARSEGDFSDENILVLELPFVMRLFEERKDSIRRVLCRRTRRNGNGNGRLSSLLEFDFDVFDRGVAGVDYGVRGRRFPEDGFGGAFDFARSAVCILNFQNGRSEANDQLSGMRVHSESFVRREMHTHDAQAAVFKIHAGDFGIDDDGILRGGQKQERKKQQRPDAHDGSLLGRGV
jgi:hypothetical protein